LPAAQIIELTEDDDVVEVMREAAARAEVLGVAGGDGTINAAATAAMAHDIPLLVVPAGTFNHFARDLQLDEIADAIEALQTGRAVRIDVGDVNGEPFLNTASLGSYPEFVRVRERLESKLGKPLAAAVAVVHVFRNCPPLAVEIDGVPRRLEMLFIGNGLYSPRGLRPQWRPRLDSGLLDVRLLDSARYVSRWRLLIGAVTGTLPRSDDYIETRPSQLKVAIDGPPGYLGRDGEVSDAPDVAVFSVRRAALTVYR
jgi:undecaprenyl-diphosphatase